MVLTRGDDFPIHQTSEPIAYAGTDRNYYDRYFFNGYGMEGELFFAVAFGVYPHLNIADAAFCLVDEGVQTSLHASKWLGMERMDLTVGPISIEVLEPLQKLKVTVDAPDRGLAAEIVFEGRAFPIEEPRFIRRNGPRTFMDYTRLTQNGRWTGWVERDGKRQDVAGFFGTRDRSWGVRPIGAPDADRDRVVLVGEHRSRRAISARPTLWHFYREAQGRAVVDEHLAIRDIARRILFWGDSHLRGSARRRERGNKHHHS